MQVCFNKMPQRKDTHLSEEGYKAISQQFEVHYSAGRKIIKWGTFKTSANPSKSGCPQQIQPKFKETTTIPVLHARLYRPQ